MAVQLIKKINSLLDKRYAPIGIIAILSLLVYSNSFLAPFTLDDFGSIANNYAIRNPLDPAAIWKFYSNRFILYYTLSINYFIHANFVVGYHITNLGIHIFNGYLVYSILLQLFGLNYFQRSFPGRYKKLLAVTCALLFVVHPVQVNAVTYMVQRTASLASCFYLLAILFFIKYRISDKKKYFALVLLFTVTAMFTKENTITIPFMLMAVEIIFFTGDQKTSWLKRVVLFAMLLATVPIIPGTNLVLHGYSQSDPGVSFKASTSMDRLDYFYTQMNVLMVYIKLLFFPYWLNFDYSDDFPISHTIWENNSHIYAFCLGIILLIGLFNIRKNKLVALGILWFFITISVESSLISIKDVYFEHRLYLPLAGFILCIAGIIFSKGLFKTGKFMIRKPLLVFMALSLFWIVQNSGLTLYRNYIFSDTIRLWSDVVAKAPGSDRAHSVLGGNYLDSYEAKPVENKEHLLLAEQELKKAIELNDYNDTAHCNLSKVYLLQEKYDLCIEEVRRTNNIRPSVYAYNNLGSAYKKMGKSEDAIQAFLSGYRLDGKATFILENLGDMYYEANDWTQARFYYEEYNENTRYNNEKIRDRLKEMDSQTQTT